MPVYTYSALDQRGRATKGIINADSARAARSKLRQAGLFPTELLEVEKAEARQSGHRLAALALWRRVRSQDLTVMIRQFATLLAANLTVVDALTALIEQTENATLKKTLIQVRERLNEGSSLAAALAEHRRVFSPLMVNMVRAGEASGALPPVLLRLADFSERQLETRKRITAKMYYPLFMLAVGTLVLFALLTYVVPTVTTIFATMQQTLPWPTRVLIAVSTFLRRFWWLLALGVAGLLLLLQRYGHTEGGRQRFDAWKLRAPLVGKLALKVAMARFTRTLGMLLRSGIPLLDALDIAKAVVNNTVLAAALDKAREAIREGSDIATPLRTSGHFPPLVAHMIAIGEKSGQLEEMLLRVADAYDNEVHTSVEGLTSLVEPVIIVIMAGVVFAIMLAVLLPIFEINTLIR
ncbi:MAG: type II secretion system protein GspF [Candidatus Tectimicrobiota bacterium]|nr:MAG: type II secretion system protein GspF [Candidatus Tectomicrobia bacterium]